MNTKKCSKCGVKKDVSEFGKSKGRLQRYCKPCNMSYLKEYTLKNRKEFTDYINSYKSKKGCAKCGETCHYMLDFHYVNEEEKEYEISKLVRTSAKPDYDKFNREASKCVILCSNHHREFHYFQHHEGLTIEEYLAS